ncbi:hypothetical protein [uncultured Polaribacter sp.]|jgi:hypothetical protein|uniref:hypothetical protein n=1 Tax=uncultured Polaribacter sp. TaxID=174711 RepID=UPI00259BD403|nr:hypothetical protein [uncultured Polaribacter sp.]
MADFKKPQDPNWVATFSLKRNADKLPGDEATKNRPDLVLSDSDKVNPKTMKPYRKNFTIDGVWMEASAYVQEDKSVKITIKKTGTGNAMAAAPAANREEIPF